MIPILTSPIPSTSYQIVSLHHQQINENQPELQKESTYKHNNKGKTQTSETYKKKPTKLLKPIVPPSICIIHWTLPTPEARTEFVKIHHRQINIHISKCQYLNTLLTDAQFNTMLNSYINYGNYLSKRIVYISTKQEEQTLVDPDQKWKELFSLQVPSLKPIPRPTSKKEHKYTLVSKQEQNRLHKRLDEELRKLFSKLETGTITYNEYTILRGAVRQLKGRGIDAVKSLLFPCTRGCNDPKNSGLRRFTAPIFLLAANAFLSMIPKATGIAKILQPHQQLALQQIQECNFCSLMELETVLSILYPVLSAGKFKKLLDNALAILEQKNILPLTGPINDVTQHNNRPNLSTLNQSILDIPIPSTTIHNQYDEPSTSSEIPTSWTNYKQKKTTSAVSTTTISEKAKRKISSSRTYKIGPESTRAKRKKTTSTVSTTTVSEKAKGKISSARTSRIGYARTRTKPLRTNRSYKTTPTIIVTNQPIYAPDNEQTAFMFALHLKPTEIKRS